MKIALFYHSLLSDWNDGNVHLLRGVVKELLRRGHDVTVWEPTGRWSLSNLIQDHGEAQLRELHAYYPTLEASFYDSAKPDYDAMLTEADLVIVHEWNEPELVAEIGARKSKFGYKLLFHDTHHRAASEVESMSRYDFSQYDGALLFGEVIKKIYEKNNWIEKSWTWHEAADAQLFAPQKEAKKIGDLVWIGN